LYQRKDRPETLFGHVLDEDDGFLVTFTGQQARFTRPDARPNELARIVQRSWRYPDEAQQAADYLVDEAQSERDAYFGVHLFREPHTRLASNAAPTVRCLWLDEDEGSYPGIGPEPTAIVSSSRTRRHLYWRLAHPVAVEWAVAMNRRLAAWARGDISKAGAASVLRVPGTWNFKRHPEVDPVFMEITHTRAWGAEIMEQAVPEIPSATSTSGSTTEPYNGPELELAEFLEGVEVIGEVADGLGSKLAIVCPWVHEHDGGDRTGTYVGQRAGGGLWFYCNHGHCQGRGWPEFRHKVGRVRTILIRRSNNPTKKVRLNRG